MNRFSRRLLIKIAAVWAALPWAFSKSEAEAAGSGESRRNQRRTAPAGLGTEADGFSRVFLARNGTPQENVAAVVAMQGGIEKLVGERDIVVIKPNAQWWNQGMTNTDAMRGFIDMVLARPGFSGEVIIADNHQFAEADSRGWTTDKRNGSFNYNELIAHYRRLNITNVTKAHWHVAGKTDQPLEGDAQGKGPIRGPEDGDGYVWLEQSYYLSPEKRKCLMTYPVFTSAYSGITVDLKNGPWKEGAYLRDRRLRFINFSALNHHGFYCGVTASVKNLMGVVDMSCGFPGNLPERTYNTHHIGVRRLIRWKKNDLFMGLAYRLGLAQLFFEYCYANFHHTGGSLGCFMRSVRMPDLHIITAERVGWGSRTDVEKSHRARTILASRDPVALDFIAARDVLLPATPEGRLHHGGVPYRFYNDPENFEGPLHRFLQETARQGIGTLDPARILVEARECGRAAEKGGE